MEETDQRLSTWLLQAHKNHLQDRNCPSHLGVRKHTKELIVLVSQEAKTRLPATMPVVGNPRTLSQRPGEAQQHQVDETEENYGGRSTNHFHGSGPQDHPKGTIKAASLTPKDNDPARTDNSSEVVQPLAVTPKTAYSPQLTVTVARPLVEPKCTETWLVRENIRTKQGSSCMGPSSDKEEGYMYQEVQKGELHEHCVVKC